MPLIFAPTSMKFRIIKVSADEKIKNHLASLGIVEEGTLELLSHEASGVIIKVKDSRLALDKDIASRILVSC